jgi:hypothetical protein
MNYFIDRDTRANVDTHDSLDISERIEEVSWRNPPFEIRVLLVSAVCAMPGLLAGLMANLILHFTADPAVAATAGAVVFAFFGGRMEAAG